MNVIIIFLYCLCMYLGTRLTIGSLTDMIVYRHIRGLRQNIMDILKAMLGLILMLAAIYIFIKYYTPSECLIEMLEGIYD